MAGLKTYFEITKFFENLCFGNFECVVVKEISERTQNPSAGIIFDAKQNDQKPIFENIQNFRISHEKLSKGGHQSKGMCVLEMLKKCKIEIYCTSYEYSVLVVFQFISVTEEF